MKIEVKHHYSAELGRDVAVAVPVGVTDVYVEMLRSSLPFPPTIAFLLDDRSGILRFVDVGANIGNFTLCAAALGLECLAVEAEPRNYVLLCQALTANGFSNARALHAAASDVPGVLNLVGDSAWARVTADRNTPGGMGVAVPALPLDDILPGFGFEAPDLVKIDVEGHEASVISGLQRTIQSSRPLLIVESNSLLHGGIVQVRRVLQMLEAMNYQLYLYTRDGSIVRRRSSELQPTAVVDYLAVPRDRATARPLPRMRDGSLDEDLTMMAEEPFDSGPHVLHLCCAVVALEESGVEGIERLEELKRRIVAADPAVISFVRRHLPQPQPAWLAS